MSSPATAVVPPPPYSSSRIASALVTACTRHISDTSKLSSHGEKHSGQSMYRRDLHHEFGRFELWCRGFYEAPPGTAYLLDSVLDGTRYLKEPTILLLASLASLLVAAYPLRKVGNEHTRRYLASALGEAMSAYPHFEQNMERTPADDTQDTVVEEMREWVDSLFDVLPTLDNVLQTMQEHVMPAANLMSVVEAVGMTMQRDVPVETVHPDTVQLQNRVPSNPPHISRASVAVSAVPRPGDCSAVVGVSLGGTGDATSTPEVLGVVRPHLKGEDRTPAQACPTTGNEIQIPDRLHFENPSLEGKPPALMGVPIPVLDTELIRKPGVPGETAAMESKKAQEAQIGVKALDITEPFITGIDPLLTGGDAALQELPPESGEVPDIPEAPQFDYSQWLGGDDSAVDNSVVMAGSLAARLLSDSDDHRSLDEGDEDQELLERVIQQEPPAFPIHMTGHHWEIYQRYIRDRFPQAIEGLDIEGFSKGNAEFYESLTRRDEELGADECVLQAEGEDGGDRKGGKQEEEEGGDHEEEVEAQVQEEQVQQQVQVQVQKQEQEGDCELEELKTSQHPPILSEEPAINNKTPETILEAMGGSASRGVPATFKDSGLGSSAPGTRPIKSICPLPVPPNMLTPSNSLFTRTFLAPPPSVSAFSGSTICSTTSQPKHRRLLPRVPDHSRGSPGFTCTFCGRMQLSTIQGHAWRKHVFADLTPYMCVRSPCRGAGTFYNSKRAWVLHDTLCIRDARGGAGETTTEMCPFCLKDFGRDTGRFYSHVAHHMEDIRLFALPPAFREYEVGEYNESSRVGSSDHTGSPNDRTPIRVHISKYKVLDPLSTRKWTMQAQAGDDGIVAGGDKPISVISLEPEDDSLGRAYRRALGGVAPAGAKWQSRHREGMGWGERMRSTAGHAPPSGSTSSSEESSVER